MSSLFGDKIVHDEGFSRTLHYLGYLEFTSKWIPPGFEERNDVRGKTRPRGKRGWIRMLDPSQNLPFLWKWKLYCWIARGSLGIIFSLARYRKIGTSEPRPQRSAQCPLKRIINNNSDSRMPKLTIPRFSILVNILPPKKAH